MFHEQPEDSQTPRAGTADSPPLAVGILTALLTGGLIWYARTAAFAWDEGYHLVAAWLMAHGKQPYIDFVFPQTPVNAYWNSFLLRIFGESWHVPHTAAAILTAGAVALAASHVYRRLPASRSWRAAAAATTLIVMGCNTAVVEFGSLQAYGLCLLMIVAAYVLTVNAAEARGNRLSLSALAGFCAGVAAASSLLTAPVAPVLLVWSLVMNQGGTRIRQFLSFSIGVVIAFIPLLRLLIKAPHPVIFGFLQYQLLYRKVEWDGAAIHNLGEVLSWADSSQAVLLVLLAAAGIVFAKQRAAREPEQTNSSLKSELYLCGWLVLAITVHLLTARPTFSRYFLLTVPFLSIAASAGLWEVTNRLTTRPRPWLAASILCAITIYGLGASLFEQRDDLAWKDLEQTAAKVKEVTPPAASLLADEMVYFILGRTPPTGMELEDSHKLTFGDAEAKALHVLPRRKLDLMIRAGAFDTVEMCDDDEIDRIGLNAFYQKSVTAGTCKVFWKWGKSAAPAEP